ncbi:MAG: cytidylate kinase-like family protein [Deltaproteobacteria bacterium]|nr:cytidylate kinase-like family protein [Deltaproteobacteria bacterium]
MPLTTQQLLQRQAVRREIRRRAEGRPAPKPCIALSRFPGSNAGTLGHDVAAALGFGFYGIEIVDRMAREVGLPREIAEAYDEHVRNTIDRYVLDAFREGTFLESDYLRALVHTVRSIGEAGSAVLLGRGAPYILRPERTLSVLVVAPREVRVQRVAKERSVDLAEAERQVVREDDERRQFLMHHFRVDPDDPTRYDLAVNTGSLSREAACEVVRAAYAARFGPERSDDQRAAV